MQGIDIIPVGDKVRIGGDKDDLRMGIEFPDAAGELDTVHAAELNVEQQDIKRFILGVFKQKRLSARKLRNNGTHTAFFNPAGDDLLKVSGLDGIVVADCDSYVLIYNRKPSFRGREGFLVIAGASQFVLR